MEGLQPMNIPGKLTRCGVVPYRTLHRFAVRRCEVRAAPVNGAGCRR
ncbi:MAG: hypothetical protein LC808_43370 [Actinobacteria bacterium]|nr:hypothetical protein [Actinomycetota bacterium]HYZ07225.1 hypothetical protein [Pseudonocardiaceae bacterium]